MPTALTAVQSFWLKLSGGVADAWDLLDFMVAANAYIRNELPPSVVVPEMQGAFTERAAKLDIQECGMFLVSALVGKRPACGYEEIECVTDRMAQLLEKQGQRRGTLPHLPVVSQAYVASINHRAERIASKPTKGIRRYANGVLRRTRAPLLPSILFLELVF